MALPLELNQFGLMIRQGRFPCGLVSDVVPASDAPYLASSHVDPSAGSSRMPSEASAA